jgi:hypothetical protein
MPTGTSTIFGAFQAIRRSFLNRTTFALPNKVPGCEKFASGIFVFYTCACSCCIAKWMFWDSGAGGLKMA